MQSSLPNGISPATAEALLSFRDSRGWARHHSPKNLAESVVIEAAELLECFQWKAPEAELTPREKAAAASEIADVASYLILIADRLGVNLDAAISAKLAVLESRYPRETLGTDGSIEAYKALREKARSREALTETPQMKALLGFRSFLARNRAGEWAAASDNRIYFVRYARETIDFWRNAEAMEKNLAALYSPEEIAEALPRDFPERPDRAQLEALGLPGLILSAASRASSTSATASFSRRPIQGSLRLRSRFFPERPAHLRSSEASGLPLPIILLSSVSLLS